MPPPGAGSVVSHLYLAGLAELPCSNSRPSSGVQAVPRSACVATRPAPPPCTFHNDTPRSRHHTVVMTTEAVATSTRVSVLGTGFMGATIARTLVRAGCTITVWNRSGARAKALEDDGCQVATHPAQAVAASPLVIMCVLNAAAVDEILGREGVAENLSGKTIANLTTESVQDGAAHADLVRAGGGAYLGGGILAYPRAIGTPGAVILYSGDTAVFERHAPTLSLLAGAQQHVGTGDTDAAVAYAASWIYYYGGLGGFFEAAAYAKSAGISPQQLKSLATAMTEQLSDGIADVIDRLLREDFESDQADVNGHIDGIPTFVNDARTAGVDATMINAFVDHCRHAAAAGHGDRDIAAVVKSLRRGA